MTSTNYDRIAKTVTQTLEVISLYDLEGDFENVIKNMQSCLKRLTETWINNSNQLSGVYLDGSKKKTVQFNNLRITIGYGYEEEKTLQVVGTRPMLHEELKALEAEQNKQKDYELKQLKMLKAKYPNEG